MKSNLTTRAALAVILFFCVISSAFSQQTVAIGDSNPKANAILYLKGNGNQGLIIPIVSSLGSFGEAGMVVYHSADKKIHFHDGSTWNVVGGSGGVIVDPVVGNEVTGVGTTGGLAVTGAGTVADPLKISMIAGTSSGQVLKWNNSTGKWELGTDNSGNATLNSAQILVGNASNVATAVTLSGDATLSNAGVLTVANNSINAAKISDGTIANADIAANAAIAPSKIGQAGAASNQVLKWNGSAWAPAADDAGSAIALNAGQILIGNASNIPTPVLMTGDGTMSNAGALTIGSGSINSAKIADGTIVNADVATNAAIAPSKIGQAGAASNQVLKWNGSAWAPAADDAGTTVALNAGQILVGNAANVPTPVLMSGDGTVSNAGALTIANAAINSAKIADGTIVNADVATNAAIAPSKIGQAGAANNQVLKWNGTSWAPAVDDAGTTVALNAGQILVGNASNVPTATAMSGDGVLSNAGALTIANNAITSIKIQDGVISSADVSDGAIMNVDVNANAAIAGTKITPDFGAQDILTSGDLAVAGATAFNALAGTGTRMVVADNTGILSTQSIPTGFSTLNAIPKGDGAGMTSSALYNDGANVGVGTTTPLFPMDVHKTLASAADANIRVYNPSENSGDKAGIRFGVGSFWAVHLNTQLNGNWLELTNNSGTPYHRWTVDSYYPGVAGTAYIQGTGANLALMGGYTGIGTNSPDRHLEVVSSNFQVARLTGTGIGAALELRSTLYNDWLVGTAYGALYLSYSTTDFSSHSDQYVFNTNSFISFQDNAKSLGTGGSRWTAVYAVNGTVQTSDIRFKTNIKPLAYGLDEIMKLKPVSYSWKSDLSSKKVGLIAQEVQKIVPEVVINDETLGMNYGELVPVLINAIQEQQKTIEQLEARIDALKATSAELESLQADMDAIKKALGMEIKAQK
jgi:hypothetical protein